METLKEDAGHAAVETVMASVAPRAKSLIVTLWGDVILPFGGRIWLGSLVRLLEPLGIDERLVRTSVQRLVADGWLEARIRGRRRDLVMPRFRLTELREVQRRIYSARRPGWDGFWRLVVIDPTSAARREALRRELGWQGFAGMSPNLFVHCQPRLEAMQRRLQGKELGADIAYRFEARALPSGSNPAILWPLDSLREEWNAVGATAGAVPQHTEPSSAFALRVLMVHAMRRAVLRDPGLPTELLAGDWPEAAVRSVFRDAYRRIAGQADRFVSENIAHADGKRPAPDYTRERRFVN